MESREASSHCSPLHGVAGRRDTSLSQTHSDLIPLKWAKVLVLCTQNGSWGFHLIMVMGIPCCSEISGKELSGKMGDGLLVLWTLCYTMSETSYALRFFWAHRAGCFFLDQTQLTGAPGGSAAGPDKLFVGNVGSSLRLLCQFLGFWLLPPLWDLDETPD